MRTLADRLIAAREAAGYKKASEAIEAFGFSQFTYYQHENGTREPGKPLLERYAKAFKVSIDWLMRGVGEMKPASSDPQTAELISIFKKLDEKRKGEIADFARYKAAEAKKTEGK
jgi:transcriptional regulator with XRE-family HTH domain